MAQDETPRSPGDQVVAHTSEVLAGLMGVAIVVAIHPEPRGVLGLHVSARMSGRIPPELERDMWRFMEAVSADVRRHAADMLAPEGVRNRRSVRMPPPNAEPDQETGS